MKNLALAALSFVLMCGGAAYAQPKDDHHGAPPGGKPAPAAHGPATPAPHVVPNTRPAASPRPVANPHPGPAMSNRPAPTAMRGRPPGPAPAVGRHRLPPGIAVPAARHSAPSYRGRSWAVGDVFILAGFTGPSIANWNSYALPRPRRGTHWIYVDGYYLMVGNRTGHIFAEVAADY